MAMTVKWYGNAALNIMKGNIALDTDTFKMTLHTSSYTPNIDTHNFFDDATNELASANGYTAGGVALAGTSLVYDSASQQARWDFADPTITFTASTTWRYAVISKSRGGAASADELVALIDFGADQTSSIAYTFQLNAAGLLYIDVT